MRIILLGAPGVGKGTQAIFLTKMYQIPLISTGEIFRSAVQKKTPLGNEAKMYMDKGALVPDEVVIGLVKERLKDDDCQNGYLLDGFPRTIPQALALKEADIEIDCVIEIVVADQEIEKRLTGRRVHLPSGRVYHVECNPPLQDGLDDLTKEPLVIRDDDKPETVKQRLLVYHQKTKPLIDYYKNLANFSGKYLCIDGVGTIEDIETRVLNALQK